MILVTGAAGKTGQAIIQGLLATGAAVRAFVYRDQQGARLEALGVPQVVVGDMADPAAYRRATAGIERLYHICANMHPAEEEVGRVALEAAQANGVNHFVYHSVLHPQTEKMPHHWHKLRVEEMLFESGLDVTILQPAAYMQNVLGSWPTIVEQGRYRVPYPPETRLAMVDLEDVAAVAVKVLTEPGHAGAVYELAGPAALSQIEVAAVLSQGLGRPVQAERWPLDQWLAEAAAAGLSQYALETLVNMFHYYERYGFWGNANVLRWLLGREPTQFHTFVERVRLDG